MYESFVTALIKELTYVSNVQTIVIDANNFIKSPINCSYCNKDFDQIYEKLEEFIDNCLVYFQKNNYDFNCLNKVNDIICIIVGVDKFLSKLSSDNRKSFDDCLKKAKELKKISFVYVDTIDVFKNNEYESWYKNSIISNQGIWLGSGLGEQYTLKVSTIPKIARSEIPDNFGFVVNKGTAEYVKFIEDEGD